jgi:malonyl-CoA O-methyltransferase
MQTSLRPAIDPDRVQQLFERRTTDSFISHEIGERMAERLDLVRIEPKVVLDAGQGRKEDRDLLRSRYGDALLVTAQVGRTNTWEGERQASFKQVLRRAMGTAGRVSRLASRAAQLPLLSTSTDMVWSNGLLEWVEDADAVIAEWSRVLKPGGLLMFATLGPDTLDQVRQAFADVDQNHHTIAFTDLHDYGDMLASHGFVTPVMDMERLNLTFSEAGDFWRDVQSLGGNPLAGRRRGLMGRAASARLQDALESLRDENGRLTLTFEIIYGHAWKGEKQRRLDGLPVVSLPATKKSPG